MTVLVSVLRPCTTRSGLAILHILYALEKTTFAEIKYCMKMNSGYLCYYTRIFRKNHIIHVDPVTKIYTLTERGTKYYQALVSTQPDKVAHHCDNSLSGSHDFLEIRTIVLCRHCAFVHKRKEILT